MSSRLVSSLYTSIQYGGLAHLARALAWHARGDRFESDILHEKSRLQDGFFIVYSLLADIHFSFDLFLIHAL
jgi:hypothetical protein